MNGELKWPRRKQKHRAGRRTPRIGRTRAPWLLREWCCLDQRHPFVARAITTKAKEGCDAYL
jgi:hypothetical protein